MTISGSRANTSSNANRGYAEDAYDRVKQLQGRMDRIESKLDKILDAVS